jgi:hypothetical protein
MFLLFWPSYGVFVDTYAVAIIFVAIILCAPLAVIALVATDILNSSVTIVVMSIFWTIIIFGDHTPTAKVTLDTLAIGVGMILFLPAILLSVVPAKAVSRRLIFLGLGLLLLLALNELSKLGLDLTAHQVQG